MSKKEMEEIEKQNKNLEQSLIKDATCSSFYIKVNQE